MSRETVDWRAVLNLVICITAVGVLIPVLAAKGTWIAIACGALFMIVLSIVAKVRQRRAERIWEGKVEHVVRTEKIEDLGHTLGGLSDPGDAEAGALSEAGGGQLSEPEAR